MGSSERLYGQGTRQGMGWMFAVWTLVGVGIASVTLTSWYLGSRIVFGATMGFFSAMFPYLNRVLAVDDEP